MINILLNCDTVFSNYLANKNCRWDNPTKRDTFKANLLKNSNDLPALRENLKYMHEQFLYVENLGGGD